MTGTRTVLLDANVLYPAPIRDILMELAVGDLFRVRWTDDIHEEWIRSLLRKEPHRNPEDLERTRNLMNLHTRDSLVTGHHEIIPSLELPDPGDCHVLAAAIVGSCDTIITNNLLDFPASALEPHGIVAENPDDFLAGQLSLEPDAVCSALQTIRGRLKKPAMTQEEYLSNLRRIGLPKLVDGIESLSVQNGFGL